MIKQKRVPLYKSRELPIWKVKRLTKYSSDIIVNWFIKNKGSCLVIGDIMSCNALRRKDGEYFEVDCDKCLFSMTSTDNNIVADYLIENNYISKKDALRLLLDNKIT